MCSDKLNHSYDSESFEQRVQLLSSSSPRASLLDTSFELRDNRRPISPEKMPFCYDLISLNSPTVGLLCDPHARITPKGFPPFIPIQDSSSKPQNYVSTSPFCGLDVGHETRSTGVSLFSMATSTHSLKPDYLSEFDPLCRTSAFESSFGHPMSNVDANRKPWCAYAESPFTESIASNPEQPRGSVGITSANIGVLPPSVSQNTTRADFFGNETSILYSGSRGMVPTFLSEDAYSTPPMPCHDVAYENKIQTNFRGSALHYPTKAMDLYQGKSATNVGFTAAPWPRVMQQDSTPFVQLSLSHLGSSSGNWTGASKFNHKSELNADSMPRIHSCQSLAQSSSLPINSKTLSHCSTQLPSSGMPLEQRNGFPLLRQRRLGSKNSYSHTTFTKSKATFQDCFENETSNENVPAPMEDSSLKELTSSSSFKRFRYVDLDEGLFTPFMTTAPKTESEKQQKHKEDPLMYRYEQDSPSRCTISSVCPSKTSRKTYAECNQPNGPSTSVASSAVEILFDSLNGLLSSLISKSEMSKSPKKSNQAQSGRSETSSASRSTAAEGSHTVTQQPNISSAAVQSEHLRVIENSQLLKSPVLQSSDGLDSRSSPKYRRITENDCSTSRVHVSSLRATESENSEKSTIPVPASKKKRCKKHLDFDSVGSLFSPQNYTESISIPLDNEKHTIATKEKYLVKLVVSTAQQSKTSAVGSKSLQVHASSSSSNESEPSEIRPQSPPTCVTARQDQRSKLHELCTRLPLKPQSTVPRNDVLEQCESPPLRDVDESPATSKYNQDELPKSDFQSRTIPKSSLLVSKKKSRFIAPSIDDDLKDGFSSNVNAKVRTSDVEKCEKCAWVQKDDPVLHCSHQENISSLIRSKILKSSDVFDATESPDDDVEASLRCRELLHPRKRPAAKELLEKPNAKFTHFAFENIRPLSTVLYDCQTTSYQESGEDGENKLQANIRSSHEQCYPRRLQRPEKQTPTAVQQPGEKIKFVDEKNVIVHYLEEQPAKMIL